MAVDASVAQEIVEAFYPVYRRNRAPTITITGDTSVSVSMAPIKAFVEVDKTAPLLFDYSDPADFIPNKPVPPSPISWPSGDGRGVECKGTKGSFDQADTRKYGPFPDFFKVRFLSLASLLLLFLQ